VASVVGLCRSQENIFAEHNMCMGSPSLLQSDGETGTVDRKNKLEIRFSFRRKIANWATVNSGFTRREHLQERVFFFCAPYELHKPS
jgi:hypothetical protein